MESGRPFSKNKFFELLSTTVQADDYLKQAPIVYVDGAFFVIAGVDSSTNYMKTIGRLDEETLTWSKAGNLNSGRHGSNAIFDGSVILVVGGNSSPEKTEKCVISGDEVTCTAQSPELRYYVNYPELFLVPSNFCQNYVQLN